MDRGFEVFESRWNLVMNLIHLWYCAEVVAMRKITVIFHKMLVRIVADEYTVDL